MIERKIYGSIWFGKIGIVTMNDGYNDKAYIEVGQGIDEESDIKYILEHGKPFPFKQAIELTGGK